MDSRSDNLILMDFFVWVGLSAVLWRNLSLVYPLGKEVAFVCPWQTRDTMMVFSCTNYFMVGITVPTFHCTEHPFPSLVCRFWMSFVVCPVLLLIVVCTGFYAKMFWDSFSYTPEHVCKYTHIYIWLHRLISDGWMIHWPGFVPLPILFLKKWDPCEKSLSWDTSPWMEVKYLLRVYIQIYKKQYLVTGTLIYAEQQKEPFSSMQNLYLKGKYSALFWIILFWYKLFWFSYSC